MSTDLSLILSSELLDLRGILPTTMPKSIKWVWRLVR